MGDSPLALGDALLQDIELEAAFGSGQVIEHAPSIEPPHGNGSTSASQSPQHVKGPPSAKRLLQSYPALYGRVDEIVNDRFKAGGSNDTSTVCKRPASVTSDDMPLRRLRQKTNPMQRFAQPMTMRLASSRVPHRRPASSTRDTQVHGFRRSIHTCASRVHLRARNI